MTPRMQEGGRAACLLALALAVLGCAGDATDRSGAPPGRSGAQAAPVPARPAESAPEIPEPPSPARLLSQKGERAYRQENYDLAERLFREALAHEPDHLHALTGLGWTLYDARRPDEAFFFFQRANRRHPEDGSARRGLAYLLYRYGRREEARALLGSLDKGRWPELANVDDERAARAIQGLPAPAMPKEKDAPQPGKAKPLGAGKPPAKPAPRMVRPAQPPAPARKEWRPPAAQGPSLENMADIPGGRFRMGARFVASRSRARGRRGRRRARLRAIGGRMVEVRAFRLDRFEVTNSLYAAFVKAVNVPEPPFWRRPHFRGPHLPVVGVTWWEARAYCAWAGKRLPTEAEWEYAAQGAGRGGRFPWGAAQRGRNAVFGLNPDTGGPKAVGRRPDGASPQGVEDLAGNVWEWVEDVFRKAPGDAHPVSRNGHAHRTLKGGSWVNGWWALASSSRTGDAPARRLPAYGFRCAADARK